MSLPSSGPSGVPGFWLLLTASHCPAPLLCTPMPSRWGHCSWWPFDFDMSGGESCRSCSRRLPRLSYAENLVAPPQHPGDSRPGDRCREGAVQPHSRRHGSGTHVCSGAGSARTWQGPVPLRLWVLISSMYAVRNSDVSTKHPQLRTRPGFDSRPAQVSSEPQTRRWSSGRIGPCQQIILPFFAPEYNAFNDCRRLSGFGVESGWWRKEFGDVSACPSAARSCPHARPHVRT